MWTKISENHLKIETMKFYLLKKLIYFTNKFDSRKKEMKNKIILTALIVLQLITIGNAMAEEKNKVAKSALKKHARLKLEQKYQMQL
jgi:hypothetical protein